MVFFQACLLAGYAYAHCHTRLLGVRRQAIAAPASALAAAAGPADRVAGGWSPPRDGNPIFWLLIAAHRHGRPAVLRRLYQRPAAPGVVRATGHRDDPYVLYAASNVGSMVRAAGVSDR